MLPTFVLIGAPRSGTTTLHFALEQHPEVFVSQNKEPNSLLFDDEGVPLPGVHPDLVARMHHRSVRTRLAYEALFEGATSQHRAIGEASPAYMHFPAVGERIEALLPGAKLVAVLRQPVEQALSLYTVRLAGQLPAWTELVEGFVAKLESETADGSGYGLGLGDYGCYHRHLQPFFERFGQERIHVMLTDELETEPGQLLAALFEFLGVDSSFRPDLSRRLNESGIAQSGFIHRALAGNQVTKQILRRVLPEPITRKLRHLQHRVRSANLTRAPTIPAEVRRSLTERFFGEEIAKLERLIGRDLSSWRS
jgi:Sulfotransferase family